MVDGYDGREQVQELCSADFYASAHAALSDEGVLVVNLWSSDARFDAYSQRIEATFQRLLSACRPNGAAMSAVLAFSGALKATHAGMICATGARSLQALYGLEFLRFVEGMRELKPRSAPAYWCDTGSHE